MFISKFWIALTTLAAMIMLAVIILAKDAVNRERVENATAILYKEISKADVALKLHARKRLDVLLAVAVDPEIRRMLTLASMKPQDATTSRDKILGPLRKLNNSLGEYKADLLIALDAKGTVIAQVGEDERQSGYNLAGFPAVDAALRGYVRDDIWRLDKEIFLIAARPVIHEGRYVGAVVHGMKLSDQLATDISPTVQFAIFSGNLMLAVGRPHIEGEANAQGPTIAQPLGDIIADQQFKQRGYSDVRRLKSDNEEFMAVYAKVRGEAAYNDVGYAVVVPLSLMGSPTDVYDRASKQDIEALPYVWLSFGFVLLTAIGMFWTYFEGQRPVSRLLRSIEELSKSDPKDQMNVYRFRRKIRKIAVAINQVIDYKLKAVIEDTESSSVKSIDSILGHQEDSRLSSASFKFVEASPDEIPPPPPLDEPAEAAPKDKEKSAGANKKQKEPDSIEPERPQKTPPPPKRPPTPPTGGKAPGAGKTTGAKELDEDEYFKSIYEQFVELKKKLGESVEQLTLDRFKVTLQKNRDTLKARYHCQSVKFQVYEKEGKASLKATPVKE